MYFNVFLDWRFFKLVRIGIETIFEVFQISFKIYRKLVF